MSIATTFSVLFGLLIVLLVFNIPLVASIGLPTAIAMIASDMNFATLAQRVHASVDSFTMLAIPLFMLAGKLMEVGGMSRRIVDFADELVGWIGGGLAHVMIISSAFFGALSGSSAATCASIGSIMIPEMQKKGYKADFCAGLQAVAAIDIIPPSITMITYAVASGTSVGALFMGGIIPGLFIAVLLMITVGIKVKREKIVEKKEFNLKNLGKSFIEAIPALMVPIIILGGMFSGMFTATESGAIACLYGFLIGVFYYKELNRDNIFEIIGGAITNTVLVMLIVGVSGAFSWMLTTSGASNMLRRLLGDFVTNKYVFLLISNIIFIFLGMFIESVAAILIVTPIMHPIAVSLGINPVHYGIIMVTNLAIGLCTPPVGENQYIVSAIADIPFEQEVKSSLPFVMVAFLGLFIITYIPDIVMFLPNLLGY